MQSRGQEEEREASIFVYFFKWSLFFEIILSLSRIGWTIELSINIDTYHSSTQHHENFTVEGERTDEASNHITIYFFQVELFNIFGVSVDIDIVRIVLSIYCVTYYII